MKKSTTTRKEYVSFVTTTEVAERLEQLVADTCITRSSLCSSILGAAVRVLTPEQVASIFGDEANEKRVAAALMAAVGGRCE